MKKIFLISIIFIGITFYSCESLVEGLNDNPNQFTDAPINLLLNHTLLNLASIAEAEPARMATMLTDQFTGVDRQYGTYNTYSTVASHYDEVWEDIYQKGVSQAQITKAKATSGGNSVVEGQALILEAYYFGEAALLFGDVPFSEVNGTSEDPKYEGQEAVLNGVIAMLDNGIAKAGTASASNNVLSTSSTWTQIGNALKARYLLALKKYAEALAAAEAAKFDTPENSWLITHSSANYGENLFWQFEVEQRQDYLKVQHSYMSNLLNSTKKEYRGNSKTDESGRFAYYVNISGDSTSLNTSSTGFAGQTNSFPVISFEEVQLIIAECATLTGANDKALAAINLVRANNAKVYGTQYDAYTIADFATGGIVNKGLTTSGALQMEALLEKYCSVIGLPTFQDVRRTKNLIGAPIKNSTATILPQRFLYPSTESASNKNFPGLVDFFVPTPVNK